MFLLLIFCHFVQWFILNYSRKQTLPIKCWLQFAIHMSVTVVFLGSGFSFWAPRWGPGDRGRSPPFHPPHQGPRSPDRWRWGGEGWWRGCVFMGNPAAAASKDSMECKLTPDPYLRLFARVTLGRQQPCRVCDWFCTNIQQTVRAVH